MTSVAGGSDLLGVGLYSVGEASRLLRIPSSTLRRWIDGYTFPLARWSRTHKPGLFVPALPRLDDRLTLTFLDLVQLRVVRGLRLDAHVPLQRIRTASKSAAKVFGTSHPLASVRFLADSGHVFALARGHGYSTQLIELSAPPQMAIDAVLRQSIREIDASETGLARRWYPLGASGGIVIDPQIAFGSPVLEDSGIPTRAIWEQSRVVSEPTRLADWFRIDVSRIADALRYEEVLTNVA